MSAALCFDGAEAWPAHRAGATLTIDLDAIAANHRLLAGLASGAGCAAVVKADAYGLGLERVGPALLKAGATEFFVAHLDEAIALRRVLPPSVTITAMHGALDGAEADCVHHDVRPVLNSRPQLANWRAEARRQGRTLPAVLQVDSGMSRFGMDTRDVAALADDPAAFDGIDVELVMSHLACADDPADPANAAQRTRFMQMRTKLPDAPASLAASSGIFLGPDYHFDVVRPGAALYGVAPNAAHPNPLRPVVRLDARVVQIREIGAGDGVGYGLTYRATAARRIGTIATGYADGFARHGAVASRVWFDGIELPVLGRISMDSMSIDLSAVPESRLSSTMSVELIGPHRSVDDVAAAGGTIGYEILTSLGRRYHRTYAAL